MFVTIRHNLVRSFCLQTCVDVLLTERHMFKDSIFLKPNLSFEMFSLEHFITVAFFAIGGFFLIRWARKQSVEEQDKWARCQTNIIMFFMILWTAAEVYMDAFTWQEDLPLHLCHVGAIFAWFLARNRSYKLYEVLFFWVIAGTAQGIVTPYLYNSFPQYNFFKFWTGHAGLVVFILYATFVYPMRRPTLKSVFRSFLWLHVYAAAMFVINWMIGANYFYMNEKPPSDSLLNVLGDWPIYLLSVYAIIPVLFLIIYLPFYFTNKREQRS